MDATAGGASMFPQPENARRKTTENAGSARRKTTDNAGTPPQVLLDPRLKALQCGEGIDDEAEDVWLEMQRGFFADPVPDETEPPMAKAKSKAKAKAIQVPHRGQLL